MDDDLPDRQPFLKKIWAELTDFEKSPIYRYFKHPKERKIGGLVKRLCNMSGVAREEAIEELVKIGEPAVPALVKALGDKGWDVKANAAWALGEIGDASTVPALIDALGDEDEEVRLRAAEALGKIGDASAVPALIGRLGDEDWDVMAAAAEALEKIGPRNAADLNALVSIAREAKKEGKPMDGFAQVYSAWSNALEKRAREIIADKKFHVPRIERNDRTERVMRVRRLNA